MSTSIPECSSPSAASAQLIVKPHRVLACLLCQQRKVKCDRKSPCANCIKSGAECVPAVKTRRPKRRRFPERELLSRIEHYETLLRQNDIAFEALNKASASGSHKTIASVQPGGDPTSTKTVYEPKKLWQVLAQRSHDSDEDNDSDDSDFTQEDLRETTVKKAWDQSLDDSSSLLFGARRTDVNLSMLHPEQVHIFKLWHIYLDNVNPLLKVTHTPSLQALIINAASDVTKISPALGALMFSIYSVSVLSLAPEECKTSFGLPKDDLLRTYQFGCQQALLDSQFLRSGDRDCLTAFFLYLISIRPGTDPRSLSSVLAVAIRIAKRLGIHNESTYSKHSALEAEMCRRLWWALVIFDNRICEMSDYKTTMLTPAWDCKTPLNINDFDILSEMRHLPATHQQPTDTLFAVVRSELSDFVRHSAFHLDFTDPSLRLISKPKFSSNLDLLQKAMEEEHLQFCNQENPLHFMIIWTARGSIARYRLLEHFSLMSSRNVEQNAAVTFALQTIQCDTKLLTSPLTTRYLWYIQLHFPFPAYVYLFQYLKKRPLEGHGEHIWAALDDNYRAHTSHFGEDKHPFIKIFANLVFQAWRVYEAAYLKLNKPRMKPWIVSDVQKKLAETRVFEPKNPEASPSMSVVSGMDNGLDYGTDWQFPANPALLDYSEIDLNQMDWSTMEWNPMFT